MTLSAIECARQFFQLANDRGEASVLNTDLHHFVQAATGQADALRAKYRNNSDPQLACLNDWLGDNYTIVDRYGYQQAENKIRMEVFIYQRGDH